MCYIRVLLRCYYRSIQTLLRGPDRVHLRHLDEQGEHWVEGLELWEHLLVVNGRTMQ